MSLRRRIKRVFAVGGLPIFADLCIESGGERHFIDVEQDGWLANAQPLLNAAHRIGLVMRGKKEPTVWLYADGSAPAYASRVVGTFGPTGHKQIRVAGLRRGDVHVWLHRDGLVEVGPEPSFREV